MSKLQAKADELVDKVIDHQENSQAKKQEQVVATENTAETEETTETKVHPAHSADGKEPNEENRTGSSVVNSETEAGHGNHAASHIPPKPAATPHVLKENPHQNYIYGVGSAIIAVFSLFLIPLSVLVTPASILFGISAVLYSRKSERTEGWNAGIPKFLGWASMFTGLAAFVFSFFVMSVMYIVRMT